MAIADFDKIHILDVVTCKFISKCEIDAKLKAETHDIHSIRPLGDNKFMSIHGSKHADRIEDVQFYIWTVNDRKLQMPNFGKPDFRMARNEWASDQDQSPDIILFCTLANNWLAVSTLDIGLNLRIWLLVLLKK